MLSPFIFKNIDKVKGFKISMAIEAALLTGMYFVPAGNVAAIFALVIIINIIQLAATPLQWSMLSDIIDAEEKRSGKSSAGSFFNEPVCHQAGDRHRRRAGGLYAGLGRLRRRRSWQTESALQMIKLLFTVFPGVLVALLIVIMSKYSLDDKRLSRMAQDDLPA